MIIFGGLDLAICFGYRRRRRFRVSTRRCPLPPLSASSPAKNQLIQISVKQHLGREWQPPVPRLTTALLFLTLPPLLDLVGWSITLSGSVGCPGLAQVTSSQQLRCNRVASFFVQRMSSSSSSRVCAFSLSTSPGTGALFHLSHLSLDFHLKN